MPFREKVHHSECVRQRRGEVWMRFTNVLWHDLGSGIAPFERFGEVIR